MGKDSDGPEKSELEAWGLYGVQAPPGLNILHNIRGKTARFYKINYIIN